MFGVLARHPLNNHSLNVTEDMELRRGGGTEGVESVLPHD